MRDPPQKWQSLAESSLTTQHTEQPAHDPLHRGAFYGLLLQHKHNISQSRSTSRELTRSTTPFHRCAMDSPIVAQLFRQLFRHRPAGCQARLHQLRHGISAAAASRHRHSYQQTCSYATRASRDRGMKSNESRWQQRTNLLPEDRRDEFAQYPYISMSELKRRKERPRKVKMLLRDFIDGTFYIFISQILIMRRLFLFPRLSLC